MTPDPITQAQFYEGTPSKRLFAWVLDMVLIIGICLLIVPFTVFTAFLFFPFLMFCVGFIYRTATLANKSATWGMRLMSMEIRESDDQPLSTGMAFLHTLGYSVSLGVFPLQIISIILMLTSERKQGLTDMVLGTVPMNKRL